ncbi:hypothetical protein [Nocardia macrotermitis]|uniref:Uncharacterized protein n=1 Tax=Nocardia macrotermitis TaxID=2585198 RepID=A0A7K0CY59_9NOCA|nr:hypothetical protein [Nocardia macrotermitis]MQY18425.1 hypothetical protein [Nocardia macrotermitis]
MGELTERKSRTREMGRGAAPELIARFIDREFALAVEEFPSSRGRDRDAAKVKAAEFFRAQALAAS